MMMEQSMRIGLSGARIASKESVWTIQITLCVADLSQVTEKRTLKNGSVQTEKARKVGEAE